MLPYVILLTLPLVLQHVRIEGVSYPRRNRIAMLLFFGMLTALAALRHGSVGKDTAVYARYFTRWAEMPWSELAQVELEPGFLFLSRLISVFSTEPQVYLAVTAVLAGAMIYPTYRRLCEDASLTVVLFCTMSTFFMLFSGIRQMLSIGLGFAAYEAARRKRLGCFLMAVAAAMAFHTSGFMLLFLYPVYHARITGRRFLMLVPVLLLVFALKEPIFSVLAAVLASFTGYAADITDTGAYTMLFLFAGFTVFAFLVPEEARMDAETRGLRNLLLLSLVLQMFAPLHMLAMRMNYYYIIFIPLLLPRLISARSRRWDKAAVWARHGMVLFFYGYFFYSALRGGNLNIFPYHFFWETV